jgi:hypothetical protein
MKRGIDLLWHYTSLDTLYNILNNYDNKKPYINMWATHALFLNDPNEDKLLQVAASKQISKEAMQEAIGDDNHPFVISFSKKEDDLNQWRSYGDDGRGIAIGFVTNKLTSGKYQLQNVEYVSDKDIKSELIDDDLKDFKTTGNLLRLIRFVDKGIWFKDKAYSDEEEWRIVLQHPIDVDVDFRQARGLIIPFLRVKLPLDAISEIMIGPAVKEPELVEFGIRNMLRNKAFSESVNSLFEIKRSVIPYRSFR